MKLWPVTFITKLAGLIILILEGLKEMLKIEGKYGTYGELKRYVIDKAQRELQQLYENNESDVCFVYDELKTKRAISHLHFRIKAKEKNKGARESTAEEIEIIHFYLKSFWPHESQEGRRTQIFNSLSTKRGFKEFKDKADDISSRYPKKAAKDLAGLLIKALNEDFGMAL